MKKYRQTKWLVFFIFFLLFIFSCSEENEVRTTNSLQDNFVEYSLAKGIASNIPFVSKEELSERRTSEESFKTKTVESIHESKNEKGKTCFYVINYIEGGFVILSADKKN